ncbi:MAG TPA: toll/interleukin-1 receptor domain-containing protein [Planctomycetota bacterium]|nr:toll/interleukin-1 receptor domain-containing protein [Planctomycetota bacterium]
MADEEHFKIIKQGPAAWNDWRRAHPEIKPDLTGAYLSGRELGNLRMANVDMSLSTLKKTNLRGSDFWRTDLNLSDLSGAILSRSFFGRAHLHSARLCSAELTYVRFIGSDLSGANLSHAKIAHTHFNDTDLAGADFSHAWISDTVFANVDLRRTLGLETVNFISPSSLGIDSIYRSHGQIPTTFLRGCGVPEEFVRLIPSLQFDSPLQFTCCLCFNALDRVFCEKLHADLQANGVRCWFLPDHGSGLHEQLEEAVTFYDKIVAICSKNSMARPEFAQHFERALEIEKYDGRTALYCITRDDYLANDWTHAQKETVQGRVVSDFRHWEKPESYERALGKLLRALGSA